MACPEADFYPAHASRAIHLTPRMKANGSSMLRLHLKADHPQPRHVSRAAEIMRGGGVAVYPTDTTYGLGCDLYARRAIDRIYQLKGMDRKQRMTFLCSELSQVAHFAVIEDKNYRILKHHVPGPYTFILPATREVPKIVQTHTQTVGVRVPKNPFCVALIQELGHPILSTTVAKAEAGETAYTNDPDEVVRLFGHSIELLLDAGPLYEEPSSVIDLTGAEPVIVRRGAGDLSWLGGQP
jgi:tRNA threonylcarbamoyl adenosine modification protein (Sua5/YciO/YrdC/YwlC family)